MLDLKSRVVAGYRLVSSRQYGLMKAEGCGSRIQTEGFRHV